MIDNGEWKIGFLTFHKTGKAFRENKWTLIWQARGYNKAIDDFAGKLKTEYKNAVAEQLKLKHIEKESEE